MIIYLIAFFLSFQTFSENLIATPLAHHRNIKETFFVSKDPASQEPLKTGDSLAPVVGAEAYIALDAKTGKILIHNNAYKRSQIASITKIILALVTREKLALTDKVIISQEAISVEGSKMGLEAGEEISVEHLLYGLLIDSGNDAAFALAEFIGAGDVNRAIEEMNQKIQNMGLRYTHFTNPMGFDDEKNYSTAYEVAIMAKLLLQDKELQKIVQIETISFTTVSGKSYALENTNKLLGGFLKVQGVKTGTTDLAGESLVAIANKNKHQIIGVILDSEDRFQEMKIIFDWCYRVFEWDT